MWAVMLGFLSGIVVGLLVNLRDREPANPEALAADIIDAIKRYGVRAN